MVKYSSRVTNKPRKNKKEPKKMTTQDQPSSTPLFGGVVNTGGAVSTGGVVSTGGTVYTGGVVNTGGVVTTGGAAAAKKGGALPDVVKQALVKKVAPLVKKIAPALANRFASHLPMRGGVMPGGALKLSPEDVDDVSWQDMIHTLGAMPPESYHMLQGIAAAYLDQQHPYAVPAKTALGGSFSHPKHISKIATKDVLKAPTPQALSKALHAEWVDMMQGKDVGGGLFSSLKNLFKKGVSGAGKALKALGKGATSAVQILGKGAKGAEMIGTSLGNALQQGVEIANALQPVAQLAGPRAEALLGAARETGKSLQEAVGRGTQAAALTGQALDPIIQALGPIDAPLMA